MSENTSVLQDWLVKIPIRMQSTLILGLRGPDSHNSPGLKRIIRWMRGLAFKPGNPANWLDYMGDAPPRIQEKDSVAKELEFTPFHFFTHLLQSLKVIAFRHPDDAATQALAERLAWDITSLLHLPNESRWDFEKRLCTAEWPTGKQPDSFQEVAKSEWGRNEIEKRRQ